jgi:hypothetical protein
MNKEFTPYEQALDLKELGFDEPCFMSYRGKFDLYRNGMGGYLSEMTMERNSDLDKYEINKTEQYWISAPTFSRAFRWFREKYEYIPHVFRNSTSGKYSWKIDDRYSYVDYTADIFNTYEEAELACLIKLIEICRELK